MQRARRRWTSPGSLLVQRRNWRAGLGLFGLGVRSTIRDGADELARGVGESARDGLRRGRDLVGTSSELTGEADDCASELSRGCRQTTRLRRRAAIRRATDASQVRDARQTTVALVARRVGLVGLRATLTEERPGRLRQADDGGRRSGRNVLRDGARNGRESGCAGCRRRRGYPANKPAKRPAAAITRAAKNFEITDSPMYVQRARVRWAIA